MTKSVADRTKGMVEPTGDLVSWKTRSGEPIIIGNTTITPTSQALSIQLPFGGFVWNRPVSVAVVTNGTTEEIPILDVTRTALIFLTAVALASPFLAWFWRLRHRRRRT